MTHSTCNPENSLLIVLGGNIGAGKTSLAEKVSVKLNWLVGYESVADNFYLTDFYSDMKTWTFHLSMFFLGHRGMQQLGLASAGRIAVLDRSIYEDAFVFIPTLYRLGYIEKRDYQTYTSLYSLITQMLPRPSLLVYLRCPVDILMERISQRGRAIEADITAEYLRILEYNYEQWVGCWDLCPVLTIDSSKVDYINRQDDFESVVAQINAYLQSGHTH